MSDSFSFSNLNVIFVLLSPLPIHFFFSNISCNSFYYINVSCTLYTMLYFSLNNFFSNMYIKKMNRQCLLSQTVSYMQSVKTISTAVQQKIDMLHTLIIQIQGYSRILKTRSGRGVMEGTFFFIDNNVNNHPKHFLFY